MESEEFCHICNLPVSHKDNVSLNDYLPMHIECYKEYIQENATYPELLEDEE
jgi:hypothetical protein